MKRQRFTKTEAIAVIALALVLLTLVLLPTGPKHSQYYPYHRSSKKGCFSSLKQLGMGSTIYANNNIDGDHPGPSPSAKQPMWDIALGKELGIPYSPTTWSGGTDLDKKLALFVCHADETACMPARKRFRIRLNDWRLSWDYIQYDSLKIPIHRSYSMNLGNQEIAATANKISTDSIVSPSGTIQLCELHDARNLLGKPDLAALSGKEFVSAIFDGKKVPYHGTLKAPQVNVLFYDGHVGTLDEATARKGEVFSYKKP